MDIKLTPDNVIFLMLSFEGPDPYSQAGGLGTRVHNLCETLGGMGFETHLFFIGDPEMPPVETLADGKYIMHRWCQWISAHHPNGVYDGEDGKVNDYRYSVPKYIFENIAEKAAAENKTLVVMAEEWHTAEALCNTSDLLHYHGLRDNTVLLWNANNTMSFEKIDFGRLTFCSTITAVSKFMKQIMAGYGMNAIVIPNGIPERMLAPHDRHLVEQTRAALSMHESDLHVLKIGRFDPAKRWMMAVEATARLKAEKVKSTFLIRGGMEPHGTDVLARAAMLGLSITDVTSGSKRPTVEESIELIANARKADILNLKFFIPEELVRLLYHTCDCVLANSGFEPFGLVGLEVMASGGIAFTGATGEDYVNPFVNAVTVETNDPNEIVSYLSYLNRNPDAIVGIKRAAFKTASAFTWPIVINNLLRRIEFLRL